MRVACFSPLPPRRSGIADYSAALLPALARHVELQVFAEDAEAPCGDLCVRRHAEYRPEQFDIALYQLGNNPDHIFVYQTALASPGVAVLHEFNLHHLIAEVTIRRGDWDAYLKEVEYNGGPEALEYARRVKALEVGPDYDNVAMNRRLIEDRKSVV